MSQRPQITALHRCRTLLAVTLVAGFAAGPAPLMADTPPAAPAACGEPPFRQFDFWLGSWDVFGPAGRQVGENVITRGADGCSLYESWRGRGGVVGHSLNRYDARSGRWSQVWIDNQGGELRLGGGFDGTSMVLQGRVGERLQRITWTPQADGSVRQRWESSGDDGASWRTEFDGRYVRKP